MNMAKRLAALALCLAMTLSLIGCADNSVKEPQNDTVVSQDSLVTSVPEAEEEVTTLETTVSEVTTSEEVTTTEETTTAEVITTVTTTEEVTTTEATTTLWYEVTPASEKLYATADLTVRAEPDKSATRISHVDKGDLVEVTGYTDNGWARIKFRDSEYFINASYLSSEKPIEEVTTAATTTAATTVTTVTTTPEPTNTSAKTKWVAAWGAAMLKAGNDHLPKKNDLAGSTVRQQIRVTTGGDVIKLTFSNEYGDKALTLDAVTIAKLVKPSSSDIDTSTLVNVTFGGKKSVTIAAGKTVTSDEIKISFEALEDLAVTMEIGSSCPSVVTSHTASRCSTWILSGDHSKDKSLSGAETTTAWYFLYRADTLATEDTGVIVAFGDSLTDGASVTTNAFARWTDECARQFKADEDLSNYGVVNMGIGGTLIKWDISRLTRDVINTPGVEAVVVLYGINDIAGATTDKSSEIISLYKQVVTKCHNAGIKVYFCTLTPTKGNTGNYYTEMMNVTRLNINKWIMTNTEADGYIDTAAAVASTSDSDKMDSKYVSTWNDWLHFNDTGYKFVGKTIYQRLKTYLN